MIQGEKVARPSKATLAREIARLRNMPAPNVSGGSSVESAFMEALYESLNGVASGAAGAYRRTEAVLDSLDLAYDPFWDTSEAAEAGGSTVTTRAYSRIRSALTGAPRSFILNVTDAPVGARWETNHQEVYRYDGTVTGRRPFNEAGPGSRIVYYATSKSKTNRMHFIAAATVAYIQSSWHEPWAARIEAYTPFPAPVPVADFEMDGWNRQHAITEISHATFASLLSAGGLSSPIAPAGLLGADEPLSGGGTVAERLTADYPAEAAAPAIEIPDVLPEHAPAAGALVTPKYTETPRGVESDDPSQAPGRSGSRQRDKLAEVRAVQLATRALEAKGWTLRADRQKDGVGYDLEFTRDGLLLKVEVKGIQGSRLAFNVTPKEMWRAETDPRWVLIAATSVLAPKDFRLHFVTRDRVVAADRAVTGYRLSP